MPERDSAAAGAAGRPTRPRPFGQTPSQQASPFSPERLPDDAVEIICQHASSLRTPAACLLPLVCRGWQATTDRLQLPVNIRVDLAAVHLPMHSSSPTALISPSAAAAAPPLRASKRGKQLASWLTKNRSSVRSLCIPWVEFDYERLGPGWAQDLASIRDALLPQQQSAGPSAVLPHLVHLELPVLGLPGTNTFLEGLAGCTGLQQLGLQVVSGHHGEPIDTNVVACAVAPLSALRVLHLALPDPIVYHDVGLLAGLLRRLPPSLQQLKVDGLQVYRHLSISCMTHLVNLRALDGLPVVLVTKDDSSSSSDGDSNSDSSSSSSNGGIGNNDSSSSRGAASSLTALTRLQLGFRALSSDARLHLPNLRALHLTSAEPGAWRQLHGLRQLQQLTTTCFTLSADSGEEYSAGLGGLTQLEALQMHLGGICKMFLTSDVEPWAAAVACMTRLTTLHLTAAVLVVGASALLAPLTELRQLTVDCRDEDARNWAPAGAQGWAATPEGAGVTAVAAAVAGGWVPLQRLVLVVHAAEGEGGVQQVEAAARAALPGLVVEAEVR